MGCTWGCFLLCWSLTYVRCHALMSTPVGAALFLVGALTVLRAKFSTPSVAQAPARTHSWLYWKKREISIDKEIERESVVHGPFDWLLDSWDLKEKSRKALRISRAKGDMSYDFEWLPIWLLNKQACAFQKESVSSQIMRWRNLSQKKLACYFATSARWKNSVKVR